MISFNIQTTSVILGLHSRAVGKFENSRVPAFFDEHTNLPTLVEIELTDLPKSGGSWHRAPLATTGLHSARSYFALSGRSAVQSE